ncbi:STAS domain-containing protein [Planomicrobium sp. CPCC 101079]|uniref:STAS domain-containing protein n=1 Tax=Planomicrobium sp. CPCC 101079 TaxID=2599618 RepID=UPI0011B40AE3|nr:STAS domain-containing protein [Planomicrobium sp. CPCC 101079]TWT03722.1 STAS domain-containing protein [Planomicrobium sp. CPCC 101079]
MAQAHHIEEWPLPIFKLDRELTILASSKMARTLFKESPVFTGLLEEGSRQKAVEFLNPARSINPIELTFLSPSDEPTVMDVHCQWQSDGTANAIAVPKDRHYNRVSEQLSNLRRRLNETNYDLLLEKERTEELLQNVRELSAPCIKIDHQRLLIPLFGLIDKLKMETVMPSILDNVYRQDGQTVIFDLTAMDDIDSDGLNQLNALIQSLSIMGIAISITGVHPNHAKRLHELNTLLYVTFAVSLQEVLLNEH